MGWPEGKWPLGRHGHKWKNIKGDLKNKEWSDMERIHLAQDNYELRHPRYVNPITNLIVYYTRWFKYDRD